MTWHWHLGFALKVVVASIQGGTSGMDGHVTPCAIHPFCTTWRPYGTAQPPSNHPPWGPWPKSYPMQPLDLIGTLLRACGAVPHICILDICHLTQIV